MNIKIISGIYKEDVEKELNDFNLNHNVRYSQTHVTSSINRDSGSTIVYTVYIYYEGD